MNNNRLDELKIQASVLLKNLNSSEEAKQQKAAARFLQLPFVQHCDITAVIDDKDFYRLKHAYHVLAIENRCSNWNELREQVIMQDCLYINGCPGFLNVWFNNYDEAKAYHLQHGGYLLQYRKDYFIAQEDMLAVLNLAEMQQEWEAIGYDWVKPASKEAWQRLYKAAKENYLKPVKPTKRKDTRPDWLLQR